MHGAPSRTQSRHKIVHKSLTPPLLWSADQAPTCRFHANVTIHFAFLDWRPGDKHNRAAALRPRFGWRARHKDDILAVHRLAFTRRLLGPLGHLREGPVVRRLVSLLPAGLVLKTWTCSLRAAARVCDYRPTRTTRLCILHERDRKRARSRARERTQRLLRTQLRPGTETGSVLHRWRRCGLFGLVLVIFGPLRDAEKLHRRSRTAPEASVQTCFPISKTIAAAVSRLQCVKGAYSGCTMSSQNACVQSRVSITAVHITSAACRQAQCHLPQHEAVHQPSARSSKFAWAWCPRSRMTLAKCIKKTAALAGRLWHGSASEVGGRGQEETASGDGRGSGSVLWARRQ